MIWFMVLREDVVANGADSVAHKAKWVDFAPATQRRRPEEGATDVGDLKSRADDVHVSDFTSRQR